MVADSAFADVRDLMDAQIQERTGEFVGGTPPESWSKTVTPLCMQDYQLAAPYIAAS